MFLSTGNIRATGEANPDYSGTFVFRNDFAVRALMHEALQDPDGLEVFDDELRWWTFAGGRINATLRYAIHALEPVPYSTGSLLPSGRQKITRIAYTTTISTSYRRDCPIAAEGFFQDGHARLVLL